MKKFLSLSLVAAMALSTHAMAEEATTTEAPANAFSMSGNAALTSNYLWRGISYTTGMGTGQAGVDFSNLFNVEGLYFGLWGSGIQEGSEIDYYGGYTLALSDDLSIDVGYILYQYTHGTNPLYTSTFSGKSYGEFYAGVSYADYGVTVYQEDDLDGLTAIGSATFGPVDISAGYYLVPSDSTSNAFFGTLGVNWPCMLDNSYNMNATVAYATYGAAKDQTILNAGFIKGSALALTISKDF